MIFEFMSDGFQIKVKKHSRSYGSRLYEDEEVQYEEVQYEEVQWTSIAFSKRLRSGASKAEMKKSSGLR